LGAVTALKMSKEKGKEEVVPMVPMVPLVLHSVNRNVTHRM